jgi:transcriptional regulator GlxA family with amidase domain
MHRVAVVALEQVIAFDLSIPCQVFGMAQLADGGRAYDVQVCAPSTVTVTNAVGPQFELRPQWSLEDARGADTIVVPGVADIARQPIPEAIDLLRAAVAEGRRVASVCTGAFILGAAGLLDGRRATTHWETTDELARRYPAATVSADVLFVDNDGEVLTSAGLAAGLDMCVYMVGMDHGAAVAAATARRVVIPMVRDGGQAQFIVHRAPTNDGGGLHPTLAWMERNLQQDLTLEAIARHGAMSVRTLNRRFRDEVGTTPMQWLQRARIERAKELLETTDLPVEHISDQVGYRSAVTLRQHFARRVGVPPQRYRNAFHARAPA